MRIGRWSELSVVRVCQEHEVIREVDANETSGELGFEFGVRRLIPATARAGWRDVDVGNYQLRIPYIRLYGKFFQVGIR